MSAPMSYYYAAPPVTPRSRNGPRVHSIVAASVIASVGAVGAFFAFFMGIFLADTCHQPGDLGCNNAFDYAMALGSIPAVAIAVALAGIGVGRARDGGGHGFAVAAWCVWGGFCFAWWVMLGIAGA